MMNKVGLTEKQRMILRAIELNAKCTNAEAAEITGCSEHVVRYCRRTLFSKGVISRPQPLIDFYRIGYVEYLLYFSLGSSKQKVKDRLITFLASSQLVPWILKCTGEFQYLVSICCDDIEQLFALLREVQVVGEGVIYRKNLDIRRTHAILPRKYLDPDNQDYSPILYGAGLPKVDKKDICTNVLTAISDPEKNTLKEISEALGIPPATVDFRKKQLEDKGIIVGYFYRINSALLGMQQLRLLISMEGLTPEVRRDFVEFAVQSEFVVTVQEWTGNWDYTLGVEISENSQLIDLTDKLYYNFGDWIHEIKSLPVHRLIKTPQFTFN